MLREGRIIVLSDEPNSEKHFTKFLRSLTVGFCCVEVVSSLQRAASRTFVNRTFRQPILLHVEIRNI